PASGSLFPIGTTTVTFQVEDASGNIVTCSFTVTVADNENPTIVCLAPINQTADAGVCGAIVTFVAPVGTDNAPGVTTVQTAGLPSGSLFPVGTTTNTYVVTDATGNTATCSFTVIITDDELPVIVCPADISQQADSAICASAVSIVDPTATDNCSTTFVFEGIRSDNLELTDAYPVGVTTITWTATDENNNTSLPCIQTINITDDEAPVFVETLPVDVTVECDQVPDAVVLTATDNCNSADVTFTEVRTDGSCSSTYILTRTWIATDTSNNSTQHIQIVTVEDNTPPVLSLPANVTAECSADLTPVMFGFATAIDNCDANPVIAYSDVTTNGACSGTFTITRTWTATDECGNVSTADQIISTSDTTAPEFVEDLPQDLTIECNSVPAAEILTATDNCGNAEVTVNDTRTDGNCPNNYIITRIYTATDDCGLTNTHVQTITVVDITPPTFVETLPAVNLVVECDAVPVAETLTATDTCGSASVSVADIITNGNCDNNYTIARTWTATDECGLTTTHTQIITVQDTTPPEFVEALPTDILVECDAIPSAETITATDNCGDAVVTVADVRTDGDCPNNYIISRTWTATDECGLTTRHTQTITVQDTTAPVPTSNFESTLNVSCIDIPDAPQLEFTDNCSSNVIVVFNETNSFDENVFADYEIVRTWTVRDECNNEETYTQTLFVALDEVITEFTVQDRCYDDGIVNLNDFIGDLNTNGVWELLEGDPVATVNENGIFDPTGLELSETFLPEDGGIDYKFRYTTTDAGCISITEITMNVNADCVVLPCGENDVVVSKAVTPNGDAYNEFFEISGIELCGFQYEVKIFNRWGALIYESLNYQNDWNGKAINSIGSAGKVPNGTYYYIIILKNSGLNPITGPVYLGTK
ncbi:HYR domain-containing protein, partial [Algibacter aquimarinus]|uniref:HYR-like domain-containing protein n=1 Tax=Algibacter aquimarinus TaxID=1136748 RepID=UPI0031E5B299